MKLNVPLPPLNSIKDPDVQEAFRAIISYFASIEVLTSADFGLGQGGRGGGVGIPGGGGGGGGPIWNQPPLPGQVGRIISFLENQIRNSALFRKLGERIELIDKPTTGIVFRLGRAEGTIGTHGAQLSGVEVAIAEERQARIDGQSAILIETHWQWAQVDQQVAIIRDQTATIANSFAAQASRSEILQATIGQIDQDVNGNTGLRAALEMERLVRANADGTLYGRWTVRIDLNGAVAGFGIDATRQGNGLMDSLALFRADTFAVAGTRVWGGTPAEPVQGQGPGIPANETSAAYAVRREAWGDDIARINRARINAATDSSFSQGNVDPDLVDDEDSGTVAVPFIVKTNKFQDDAGLWHPPGVYMRRAMMLKAVIDTAYIRRAAVTTLTIAGDSVTVPHKYTLTSNYRLTSDGGEVVSSNQYCQALWTLPPSGVIVIVSFFVDCGSPSGGFLGVMKCYEDGHVMDRGQFGMANNSGFNQTCVFHGPHPFNRGDQAAGHVSHYYFGWQITREYGANTPSNYMIENVRVTILGSKR